MVSDSSPPGKNIDELNTILNRGYWAAFDNGELNDDGIPFGEEYYVDEEQRLADIGIYLEIYNKEYFPFTHVDSLLSLELDKCYLLKAEK